MKLDDKLPEALDSRLKALLAEGEKVLYCQKSDLTSDQKYDESYLVVTDGKVIALEPDREPRSVNFSDIKQACVDELFGGSRLLIETEAGQQAFVYYSKAYVPEFAAIARIITDLMEGREPQTSDEDTHGHCPDCGAPLPTRGARCPLCVPKIKIIARLLGLLKPYRGRTITLIVMCALGVICQLGPPYLLKLLVDDVIIPKDTSTLPLIIGLMIALATSFFVARLVGMSLTAWLGARIVADLRSELHACLQRLKMRYFQGKESGQIINNVMHDTGELEHFLIDGSSFFLVHIISAIAIATVLFTLDWQLALIVCIPLPLIVGGGRWFWAKLIPLFHKIGSRRGILHSVLGESIRGIRSIKAFSGEKRRVREFDGTNEEMFGIVYGVEKTFVGFQEGLFWVMSLGVVAVWLLGAHRLASDRPGETLTLGTLWAFYGYIWQFYGPFQWFTAIFNWMTHAVAAAERIFSVLDARPEIYEPSDAIHIPKIKGKISFKDVRFSYERGKEVIKGVSFDIEEGEMIGLVGKSGVGKSTTINLICRFYDVDSGMITIDGHPMQKLHLADLRNQIGMVMQEPFLFDATIIENISYGRTDASFDEIVVAAKAARAHEFILQKEDGYDTVVGERGVKLSGGEKQRIAIARAILHDPPILILDEATSSVDTETEREIQDAMAALIKGRTTVGIAHRLSTLRNANRLIVLDDGKVAEIGTHDELLKSDGIYARLVKVQSQLNEIKGDVWKE